MYIAGQGLDGERRRRSTVSMLAASALTLLAVSSLVLVDALKIDRVAAPESVRALEWSLFEAPPPAPAPPRAGGAAAPDDDGPPDPAARERAPDEPRPRPDRADPALADRAADDPTGGSKVPTAAAGGGGPPGPGLPNGAARGLGAIPCPGCGGDVPRPAAPDRRTSPDPAPRPVDFEQLACRVCPDPDPKALARTRSALTGRRGGRSVVAFCVDERGHPYGVRAKQSFGDAEVDRIAVRTVQRWRLAPMRAGKKTRKVCSSVSFDIEFR